VILFRQADPRFPFLAEAEASQAAGRWHDADDAPVQYLADTPDGAWAEFLRHEEIRDLADLDGIRRTLWAVEIQDAPSGHPELPLPVLLGDPSTYGDCQVEARRLRKLGHDGLVAPSAALLPAGARGWQVRGGLHEGSARDGQVVVLFGERPDVIGWRCGVDGMPDAALLGRVRYFGDPV
jgi:hypothetical protein